MGKLAVFLIFLIILDGDIFQELFTGHVIFGIQSQLFRKVAIDVSTWNSIEKTVHHGATSQIECGSICMKKGGGCTMFYCDQNTNTC